MRITVVRSLPGHPSRYCSTYMWHIHADDEGYKLQKLLENLLLSERRSTLYLAQGIIDDLEHDLVQICGAKDDDGHPHQDEDDGPFFESIRRAMDNCDVAQSELDFMTPRPLQNKRSPKTRNPLGVVMSEAGDDVELEEGGIMKWKEATMNSNPGDAFVMDIVPGGQAKEIGLFEIGDQLQAVGNLPVAHGGFEKVVGMLQDARKSANYIKLQFDRISVRQPFERAGLDESDKTLHASSMKVPGHHSDDVEPMRISLCFMTFSWTRIRFWQECLMDMEERLLPNLLLN